MEQVNASINEKARLYEIAKGVLGAPPNAKTFDTESLLGRANQLFVVVEKGEDGKEYAHVKGILPLPQGAVVPTVPTDFVRAKDKQPYTPPGNPAPAPATATAQAVAAPALTSNITF